MRKIIHVDCDCFFAAVELRDRPELKGLPVAVGGAASARGVLSTCNYEARKYGLHSAMATSEALRRCPQLVLLPHRFEAYKQASAQVREIFARYTEVIEPLSLDEAFLDVTDVECCQGSATLIAKEICHQIEKEIGITASAGVAPNKFLAKIASDWNKPNGIYVIHPNDVADFVAALEVKKIPGVGKSTMKKMEKLQVVTCKDLQHIDLYTLVKMFGAFGKRLHDLARGIDNRSVHTQRIRKSVSVEHTYATDLQTLEECVAVLPDLSEKFARRYEKLKQANSIHKLFIKLKFSDFSVTTVECAANCITDEALYALLNEAYSRKLLPVRLIGMGVGIKQLENANQLSLFGEEQV